MTNQICIAKGKDQRKEGRRRGRQRKDKVGKTEERDGGFTIEFFILLFN